jgi:sulfur carrier protein ThiS
MGPAARNYPHDITYWAPSTENEFSVASFEGPVLLKGRWEDKQVQARAPDGDIITSQAVVTVNDDIVIGGYVVEGNFLFVSDPRDLIAAMAIRTVTKTPDLRNLETRRVAFL